MGHGGVRIKCSFKYKFLLDKSIYGSASSYSGPTCYLDKREHPPAKSPCVVVHDGSCNDEHTHAHTNILAKGAVAR